MFKRHSRNSPSCHPERSEGSDSVMIYQILRFAQNDTSGRMGYFSNASKKGPLKNKG